MRPWRKRDQILAEVLEVRGLMPLLLKHRRGSPWTSEERIELHHRLRALSHLAPFLILLALPGSALLLPLLAWWVDRHPSPGTDAEKPENAGVKMDA